VVSTRVSGNCPAGWLPVVAGRSIRMNSRSVFLVLQRTLLVLGLLLLVMWSRTALESRGFQATESKRLAAALREREMESPGAALSAVAFVDSAASRVRNTVTASDSVLGEIEIPRLGISAIVAEGFGTGTLEHAVGHFPSSALPGNPGNCGLAGHRDSFFRGLGGVRENDVIRLVTLNGTYTYRVEWTAVVAPQRVDVLDPTLDRSLTLVTCYPFAFVGHAPKRFIVRARQVEAVTGPLAADGQPVSPSIPERPLNDPWRF